MKKQCKNCKYWEQTESYFHLCEHPEIGDGMIFNLSWSGSDLVTNPEFGCILYEKANQVPEAK